ncbi:S8 family serine peptidase [Conexibacter arvalis]|uniref:Subtilisin family serine protease n=1 Tax=Conexibacter arvalis TaxID=912552 RepID=A0A840IEU2_9ACTN|nr:S8 family serine peptidase [Conexibacter arvalis]MBB4662518.1 subtilisin family serine protease [Conexibacter arvalis]
MARRALPTAVAGLLLGIALLVAATTASAAGAQPTGRIVVLSEPGAAGARAARAAAASAGMRAAGPVVPQIGLTTVRAPRGESPARAARRLATAPGIGAAEPERRMRLRDVPDDPGLHLPEPVAGAAVSPLPAGTPLQWPLLRSNFPAAWEITRGERALVGVVDTGVDASHPELAPKLAAVVDQRGSGHANVPPSSDEDGHGTHVASLACAAAGNAVGIAGAGRDCRLVVEKTDLSDASIAASIVDATDRGAHAINMSFGDDGSRPASAAIRRAIRYAYHRRVVLVAAAADEPVREQGDPANLLQPTGSGADIGAGIGLSVTAATYGGARASFAGFGSQISLAAYGTAGVGASSPLGVVGAFPSSPTRFEQGTVPCRCRTAIAGDSRYGYLAGTSMAAPQVAATAALVRALNPDLPVRAVVRLLKRTATRPAGSGWSADLGWGILDAGRAVAAAAAIDRRAPVSQVRAQPGTRSGVVALRWTSGDPAPAGVVASGVRSVELSLEPLDGDKRETRRIVLRASVRATNVGVTPGARYAVRSRALDRAGNRERLGRDAVVVRAPR